MGEFHVKNNNYEVVHCSEVKEEWSSMRGRDSGILSFLGRKQLSSLGNKK